MLVGEPPFFDEDIMQTYQKIIRCVCYFEEGSMVLWVDWYVTLKMVVCYFEDGGKRDAIFYEDIMQTCQKIVRCVVVVVF